MLGEREELTIVLENHLQHRPSGDHDFVDSGYFVGYKLPFPTLHSPDIDYHVDLLPSFFCGPARFEDFHFGGGVPVWKADYGADLYGGAGEVFECEEDVVGFHACWWQELVR
jgi:hypothetical protein